MHVNKLSFVPFDLPGLLKYFKEDVENIFDSRVSTWIFTRCSKNAVRGRGIDVSKLDFGYYLMFDSFSVNSRENINVVQKPSKPTP